MATRPTSPRGARCITAIPANRDSSGINHIQGGRETEFPSTLHATALHLLRLDHEKLTYRYASRDFRLTDVCGNVVRDVIA
jgi:hypothetical protein